MSQTINYYYNIVYVFCVLYYFDIYSIIDIYVGFLGRLGTSILKKNVNNQIYII